MKQILSVIALIPIYIILLLIGLVYAPFYYLINKDLDVVDERMLHD